MKGTILYVNPDSGYGFRGALKGEDNVKYHFNKIKKALKIFKIF